MAKLGTYSFDSAVVQAEPFPDFPAAFDAGAAAAELMQLTASADTFGTYSKGPLGTLGTVLASITGWIHQDEDAHDTCSLTACLNPLHPGPCKGWKGTLHAVAPHVWKSIEAERVKKLNDKRVAKIAELKAQGKPIPKKLLTPIIAKPHPDAGKTAVGATGEAHAVGKAISDANGIQTNVPGKTTLGQAVKTLKITDAKPDLKGPKGKKPTVASKGIATVIAQEKVTPQYKLDKAAGITDEQWKALSGSEQDVIRGELKKIQVEGFGPQQKKATELLEKLGRKDSAAKLTTEKPLAANNSATSQVAPHHVPLKPGEPDLTATSKAQAGAMIALADAIPGVKAGSLADAEKMIAVVDKLKEGGKLTDQPKMKTLVDKLAQSALKQAVADNMPGLGLGHGDNDAHIGTFNKEIKEHIEQGKPGLPPLVEKMVKHHKAVKLGEPNVKTGVEKLVKEGLPKPAPASPAKIENVAEKPAELPKHVQHAIDMANGNALGAGWSKNHLAAYSKLTPEEFKSLDPAVQAKIVQELEKAKTKFLDPKKISAAQEMLNKFNAPDGKLGIKDEPKPAMTAAQAKELAGGKPVTELASIAKAKAGVTDLEDPDNPDIPKNSDTVAQGLLDHTTKMYDSAITGQPAVKQAMADFKQAMSAELTARYVAEAKVKAYGKVSKKLYVDSGPAATEKLGPVDKASLQAYLKHLLNHSVASSDEDIKNLSAKTKAAKQALTDKLNAAVKKANAPKPEDMTSYQLEDRAHELLSTPGADATSPSTALSLADTQQAGKLGAGMATDDAAKFSPAVLGEPNVELKQAQLANAYAQLVMAKKSKVLLDQHIADHHGKALASGKDVHGNALTADDKKAIQLHEELLKAKFAHVADAVDKQQEKADAAKAAFLAAAEKANEKAAEPVKLSDYDQTLISGAFSTSWGKVASKAVIYGATGYEMNQMKQHPSYASFTQNLGDLKTAAGKIAVMHAEEHAAELNVPTDPDTGNPLTSSPQWKAWQEKIHATQAAEKQFQFKLKQAQSQLDVLRTEAGLKKRSLPKLDAPAVKTAAAETAYYQTGGYSGPNYGKPTAAKNYMVAKLGGKLGTAHMTAAEKKLAKAGTLGEAAKPSPSVTPSAPAVPVKISDGDTSISHIPATLKKTITSDYKGMPKGKYLADPAEDVFANLVNLAAAHGKDIPGGLSVDQVVKTIDETFAKQLGVSNSGMLEKKITEWLATGAGKAYAESHATPDPKVVKQLTGELDLPDGVILAPGEKVQKLAGPGPHDESLPSSAFHAASATSAKIAQDQYIKDQKIKLSAEQKKSLTSYTGSMYHTYNTYLRKGGSLSPAYKQDIINIQSAMMPLQQHTLLKRGTGWDALPAQFHGFENAKGLIGKTIEEPGFTSTTVAGESGNFGGALQLEIEAPIGTPAYFVKHLSHFKNENEMLLAAGTKFKVLSVTQSGGKTVMRVRVVGDK
jgi:hypothetical protein